MLTNLVDNAISFSPEDGTVTVRARSAAPIVEIIVDDEGPGIPEDRLEIIFDRFYSDRPATDTSRGKNSGLGFSISREIVQAHGGEIVAENRSRMARPGRRRRPLHRASAGRTARRSAEERRGGRRGLKTCTARRSRSAASAALIRGAVRIAASPILHSDASRWRRPRSSPAAAQLVADDRVLVTRGGDRLQASQAPPKAIRGKLEVRGVGHSSACLRARSADLVLVVDLVGAGEVERLPDPRRHRTACGRAACPCCG